MRLDSVTVLLAGSAANDKTINGTTVDMLGSRRCSSASNAVTAETRTTGSAFCGSDAEDMTETQW